MAPAQRGTRVTVGWGNRLGRKPEGKSKVSFSNMRKIVLPPGSPGGKGKKNKNKTKTEKTSKPQKLLSILFRKLKLHFYKNQNNKKLTRNPMHI